MENYTLWCPTRVCFGPIIIFALLLITGATQGTSYERLIEETGF